MISSLIAPNDPLSSVYLQIKRELLSLGYEREITWQANLSLAKISESDFIREAAWVILSGGMSERIVRMKFPGISDAFFTWQSAIVITENMESCRKMALSHFRHEGKIQAIIEVANFILATGMNSIKQFLEFEGPEYLSRLPYIGPITCHHLAKNLGVSTVKPDRHLRRLAHNLGYPSPKLLCEYISQATGEALAVVDLVLWRYATLNEDYVDLLLDQLASRE